jgi:beta-lactam-binding protein with PASTA domain
MPDLEGQLFTTAALTLSHAGLQMAPLKTQNTHLPPVAVPGAPAPSAPPLPAGTILAQDPAAGSRVDASTPIQLTVAQ